MNISKISQKKKEKNHVKFGMIPIFQALNIIFVLINYVNV